MIGYCFKVPGRKMSDVVGTMCRVERGSGAREFSSYPNPELLVPGAKLYRSEVLSALRAMLQYFHQNISTWIQMNQELAQCPGDILGMSVRVGYHIKVSKMPWSRAQLPH